MSRMAAEHESRIPCGGAPPRRRIMFFERDNLRVLDLLENPPPPNAKLLAAAQASPRRRHSRGGMGAKSRVSQIRTIQKLPLVPKP